MIWLLRFALMGAVALFILIGTDHRASELYYDAVDVTKEMEEEAKATANATTATTEVAPVEEHALEVEVEVVAESKPPKVSTPKEGGMKVTFAGEAINSQSAKPVGKRMSIEELLGDNYSPVFEEDISPARTPKNLDDIESILKERDPVKPATAAKARDEASEYRRKLLSGEDVL